jgi:hypothetical protein
MSESPSIASGYASSAASSAASSTTSLSVAVSETEHAANGSISDLNISKAAAAVKVQQKYAEERTKRLRPDGASQYIDLSRSDKFKHFQDDPWVDPNAPEVGVPALTDGSNCKFLILGAGYGGLVSAIRLIQAGINVDDIRIVDSAGGFGGTWYVFLPT